MSFLAALAADILQKIGVWIMGIISNKVKENSQINSDNAKAAKNSEKVKESKTLEEENRADEDLLNNR